MTATEINVLSAEDQQIYWNYHHADAAYKKAGEVHGWGNLQYDYVLDVPKLAAKIAGVLLFSLLIVLAWIWVDGRGEPAYYGMGAITFIYLWVSISLFEKIPKKTVTSGFQHPEVSTARVVSNQAFSTWNNAGLAALHRAELFDTGFLNRVIVVGGEVWMLDENDRVIVANPTPEVPEKRERIIDEAGRTLDIPVDTAEFFRRHAKSRV